MIPQYLVEIDGFGGWHISDLKDEGVVTKVSCGIVGEITWIWSHDPIGGWDGTDEAPEGEDAVCVPCQIAWVEEH